MAVAYILAIDLAKRSFQVCAADRDGAVRYNRVMTRAKLEQLLEAQVPGIVAMEACATSHFWGRFAQSLGHEVRLIPPIYVKPFVKRQQNDAADAAAIRDIVHDEIGWLIPAGRRVSMVAGGGQVQLAFTNEAVVAALA